MIMSNTGEMLCLEMLSYVAFLPAALLHMRQVWLEVHHC